MKRKSFLLVIALVLLFVSCASNTVRVADKVDFAKYKYITVDNSMNVGGYDVSGLVSNQMSKSEENNQTHFDLVVYPTQRQKSETISISYKCEVSGNYVNTSILLNDADTGELLASTEGSDPIMHNHKSDETAEKSMTKRINEIKKVFNDNL